MMKRFKVNLVTPCNIFATLLRVLNYDDSKLFIIRDIDKLTECRRQKKLEKNIYIFFPSFLVNFKASEESLRKKNIKRFLF